MRQLHQAGLLAVAIIAACSMVAFAGDADWNVNVDGNWSDSANWTLGGPSNGVGEIASLTNNISAGPRVVTLDVGVTLGTLNIGDSGAGTDTGFVTTGSNMLILDNNDTNDSQINKGSGNSANDQVDVNLQLNDNPAITNLSNENGPITIAGNISESGGAKSITKSGPNSGNSTSLVILSGDNSYTGQTIITPTSANGRNTLRITSSTALGTTDGNTLIQTSGDAGARLELFGSFTLNEQLVMGGMDSDLPTEPSARLVSDAGANEVASDIATAGGGANYLIRADGGPGNLFTISGDVLETSGSNSTLVIGGFPGEDENETEGDGVLSGHIVEDSFGSTWNVWKVHSGRWTLTANNTYSGTTTVYDGTLLVNGTHTGGGTYSVIHNGILGGTGTIGSTVILSGGTLSPGASAGTLTVGGLTLKDNSLFNYELNPTDMAVGGGVNDLLDINGDLNTTANPSEITVNVQAIGGGNFNAAGTWTLATYDSLNPGDGVNISVTNRPSPGIERRFGHAFTLAEFSHAQAAC